MSHQKRFLIVKCSALGDIIHTYPVIAYLKQRFPDCIIDWAVEKPFLPLVKAHPLVNHAYAIDSKKWRCPWKHQGAFKEFLAFKKDLQKTVYDALFDCQGNTKSAVVTFLAKAKVKVGFDIKSVAESLNILATNLRISIPKGMNVRDEYLHLVQSYFHDNTPFEEDGITLKLDEKEQETLNRVVFKEKTFMVCPGSRWRNKQLKEETLLAFLKLVQERSNCSFLFVWGSDEERKTVNNLHVAFPHCSTILDRVSLPLLQNLMGKVNLVIAMDSLPLHLAGTTQTATFSVFGASTAAKYKPKGKKHTALQGICPYGRINERRCPILRTCQTGACIRNLEAEAIFKAFLNATE